MSTMKIKLWNSSQSEFENVTSVDVLSFDYFRKYPIAHLADDTLYIGRPAIETIGEDAFKKYIEWVNRSPTPE